MIGSITSREPAEASMFERRNLAASRWRPQARLAAEEERRIEAEKEKQRQAEGRKKPGKPAPPPSDQPDPKS
jgi:hypothetical protein